MRRLAPATCVKTCSPMFFFHQWEDGTGGFDWKSRDLIEKRETALDYLGNVKVRVPIHDAVRQKAAINKETLTVACDSAPSLFEFANSSDIERDEGYMDSSVIDKMIDELLMDEYIEDKLDFIEKADASLLGDEFLSDTNAEMDSIRKWLKLRRETPDFHSYASIPEGERTIWSAWYLRHVKGNPTEG